MEKILTDEEIASVSGGAFGKKTKPHSYYIQCPACHNPLEVSRGTQPGVGVFESGICKCGYIHEKYIQPVD